jgi:apolipoprotein N-acyltransferase
MAYAANYRRVGEAVLAIVATAVMFYFGNGLNPLWPLMWIGPLPVLVLRCEANGGRRRW